MSYKRYRFPLSFRLIKEILLERGIIVSYERIRRSICPALRRKPAKRGDIWRLDEVWIVIGGKPLWLWRAVDQEGYVLDEILQTRRNTKAAKRLLTLLLRQQGIRPKRMV
nr:DDE-type integrase/transposase/recombinase [Kozakia baliensis]